MDLAVNIINKYVDNNSYVIIGVSSGPDSMCLLNLLLSCNKKIVVAHVNYNKRKQSIVEEKYLKEYCCDKKIIFESISINEYTKENFQTQARKIRYDFYKKLANKYNTINIMTAHHGEDLVETIIMRINRGSTFIGYSGFQEQYYDDKYSIIKPLINYSKKDIINYNKLNKIKYFIDKSNKKNDYTRNRIRHKILPVLRNENEQYIDKFYQYSNSIVEYDSFIEDIINDKLEELYNDSSLDLVKFNKEKELIKKRIIEKILKLYYLDDIIYVNKGHIDKIMNIINGNENNKISLPKKLIARRSYDKLFFEFEKEPTNKYTYIFNKSITLPNKSVIKKVNSSTLKGNNVIHLNSNDLQMPLIVRSRLNGDTIKVANLGSQKINDIFINSKIDKKIRDEYPIVTDSSGKILWVPDLKKSIFNDKTNGDIILEYIKEERQNGK